VKLSVKIHTSAALPRRIPPQDIDRVDMDVRRSKALLLDRFVQPIRNSSVTDFVTHSPYRLNYWAIQVPK